MRGVLDGWMVAATMGAVMCGCGHSDRNQDQPASGGSAGNSASAGGGASAAGGRNSAGSAAESGGLAGHASPGCGNGALEGAETCDDGNGTNGDGCSAACALEDGFACSGSPSACSRSCLGLPHLCGPAGDRDCCASLPVPGGTYNRGNDPSAPATVSDFRLDVYEITVGRFRQFVAAYVRDMIPAGAGKNPNDPEDTGWNSAWNASLPEDRSQLLRQLTCAVPDQDFWTDSVGVNEALPINCLSWFLAAAFCAWDGGRLPSEAEWNYAAAGGSEQRLYPWGAAKPDCSYANSRSEFNYCVKPDIGAVNRVGSESPKGDGKFGHADLAGNIWEWVQDWYLDPYPAGPCRDCANLTPSPSRVMRGGDYAHASYYGESSYRWYSDPGSNSAAVGARCARGR